MTLVAEPGAAPPGIRLRAAINGAGGIMRVHKEDIQALAEWVRQTAPAASTACR